jgi:hypothetical protein
LPSYEPTGSASFLLRLLGKPSLAGGEDARFDDRTGEILVEIGHGDAPHLDECRSA